MKRHKYSAIFVPLQIIFCNKSWNIFRDNIYIQKLIFKHMRQNNTQLLKQKIPVKLITGLQLQSEAGPHFSQTHPVFFPTFGANDF